MVGATQLVKDPCQSSGRNLNIKHKKYINSSYGYKLRTHFTSNSL